jgi:dihydroxy-acid dehydratase
MIGHISPEAMVGGPISIIKNGDRIKIDLLKETVDLKISKKEFTNRIKKFRPIKYRYRLGALAKYATLVRSASEGAITSPIPKYMKKSYT